MKKPKLALLCFIAWTALLVAFCGQTLADEYSFAIQWTRVESSAPFFYQVGAGTVDGEYAQTHRVESTWNTATITVPTEGPWFIAVRACMDRGEAEPVCSTTWTKAAQTRGSADLGPFFPAQVVIPVVPEAWLASAGQGG